MGAFVTALAGCGDGTNPDTPEGAIDVLLEKYHASEASGAPMIDASLYAEPPSVEESSNPLAPPTDTSKTVTLGSGKNDGTKDMKITIANTFTKDAGGTGTLETTVVETDTGFKFLDFTATIAPPTFGYRIPRWVLSALKPDGTGQAFIVLTTHTSGSVTRSFTNVNPANGHKLIELGANPVPAMTASGRGEGTIEFAGEVVLTRVNGKLQALIGKSGANVDSHIVFGRDGEPAQAQPTITLGSLMVDAATGGMAPDLVIPIGTDAVGVGAAVAADAAVGFNVAIGGVNSGQIVQGQIAGAFAGDSPQFNSASYTFSGKLAGLDQVSDGKIQIDSGIAVSAFISDDVPRLDLSPSDQDFASFGLGQSVYLPSFANVAQNIVLMR
jgi:hypothetical protein